MAIGLIVGTTIDLNCSYSIYVDSDTQIVRPAMSQSAHSFFYQVAIISSPFRPMFVDKEPEEGCQTVIAVSSLSIYQSRK